MLSLPGNYIDYKISSNDGGEHVSRFTLELLQSGL